MRVRALLAAAAVSILTALTAALATPAPPAAASGFPLCFKVGASAYAGQVAAALRTSRLGRVVWAGHVVARLVPACAWLAPTYGQVIVQWRLMPQPSFRKLPPASQLTATAEFMTVVEGQLRTLYARYRTNLTRAKLKAGSPKAMTSDWSAEIYERLTQHSPYWAVFGETSWRQSSNHEWAYSLWGGWSNTPSGLAHVVCGDNDGACGPGNIGRRVAYMLEDGRR